MLPRFAPISTERLRLRQPCAEDAAAIFDYASSAEVTRFMSWPRHRRLADTQSFLAFSDSEWQRWPTGPLVLEDRSNGRVIGTSGLEFETQDRASTGYVLARAFWGRGLATEALLSVVELARHLGVRRLYALCHVDNAASARVLTKASFGAEGRLPNHVLFPNLDPDLPQDVFCYGRTP